MHGHYIPSMDAFEENPEFGLPSSTTTLFELFHISFGGGRCPFGQEMSLESACNCSSQPRLLKSPTALSHDNPFSLREPAPAYLLFDDRRISRVMRIACDFCAE